MKLLECICNLGRRKRKSRVKNRSFIVPVDTKLHKNVLLDESTISDVPRTKSMTLIPMNPKSQPYVAENVIEDKFSTLNT